MTAVYPPPLNRPAAPPIGERLGNYIRQLYLEREGKLDLSADRARRSEYEMEGMRLLCLHYRIPWEMNEKPRFILLAFALAKDHVPYFRQRKYRKDMKWTMEHLEQLIDDVKEARWATLGERPLGCYRPGSVKYACNWLKANDRRYAGYDPTSLEARYKTAISRRGVKRKTPGGGR